MILTQRRAQVCPDCILADGSPVFQAYDEFIEKRDVCAACGKKYVRQLAWGDIAKGFLASDAGYRAARAAHLSELEQAAAAEAARAKVGVTVRDAAEADALWYTFGRRVEDDLERRRAHEHENDKRRQATKGRICTCICICVCGRPQCPAIRPHTTPRHRPMRAFAFGFAIRERSLRCPRCAGL